MRLVIKNIGSLLLAENDPGKWIAGKDMAEATALKDAWLVVEEDIIGCFGTGEVIPFSDDEILDAKGGHVMPAFCDSHTHLVYAGSREKEYEDKIKGLSYEQIAKRGGGILNSARLLQETSEKELYRQSVPRINEIMKMGTGAVEIKSGYGLTLKDELKMLRVIKRIAEEKPLQVISTFLGAHAFPAEFKADPDKYIKLIIDEMLPALASEDLAEYIDVFCDKGFFTVSQTARILEAGAKYGLTPKIHANELDFSGGIQTGVKHGARSVDHLEFAGEEEIKILKQSETMPTLLPGASFFLGLKYAPARKMIDSGLPLALASDFNPGSSPSGNMEFIMSLGIIKLKMLPIEVLNAVTLNGAYAMGREESLGSITPGKIANLIITKPLPDFSFMPYYYGSSLISKVLINGKVI